MQGIKRFKAQAREWFKAHDKEWFKAQAKAWRKAHGREWFKALGKALLKLLKKTGLSLWIPALMFGVFQVICLAKGVSYLHAENFRSFMINVVTLVFIAWGLTFNIPAHRWDFSIGAVMVLSVIIGGQTALALGLNAYGLLLCCFLAGAVLGAISGLIYVLLGLSAFVTSLGVALLFEAFGFILFDGQGVNAIGKTDLLFMIRTPHLYILLGVGLVLMMTVVNFTRFGYSTRALAHGQSVAVQRGLREKSDAIICYAICGAMVAVAAMLAFSRTGKQGAALGLTSIPAMFQGFLPVFIGRVIQKYSEPVTAILIGAFSASFMVQGFASLGLSPATQHIFVAVALLIFLTAGLKQGALTEWRLRRKRSEEMA